MRHIVCGCGYTYKVDQNSMGVINEHGLFSCDTWICRGCGHTLLNLANEPCARGEEALAEAERWKTKGITIYTKQRRF